MAHVFTFQRRFVPAIQFRVKVSTIRAIRDRVVFVDDQLDLRTWEGVAYRSPQVYLCTVRAVAVDLIKFDIRGPDLFVRKRGFTLTTPELAALAREEGFASWDEMRAWFTVEHYLDCRPRFVGTYYRWEYL